MEYDVRNWTAADGDHRWTDTPTNARPYCNLLRTAKGWIKSGHSWLQSLAFRCSFNQHQHQYQSTAVAHHHQPHYHQQQEHHSVHHFDFHHCHHEEQQTQQSSPPQSTQQPQMTSQSVTRFPPLILLVLFASTVFRIAESCSSRSTPKPRPPSPTLRPNITFQTYDCPEAYAKWYCLNGATCFSVRIGESILYNCECADGYMGQRCEFKDLDGSYLPNRERVLIEKASIAGGVTVAVLFIVISVMVACTYYRRRNKLKRMPTDITQEELDRKPFNTRSCSRSHQPTIVAKDPESGRGSGFHPPTSATDLGRGRSSNGAP